MAPRSLRRLLVASFIAAVVVVSVSCLQPRGGTTTTTRLDDGDNGRLSWTGDRSVTGHGGQGQGLGTTSASLHGACYSIADEVTLQLWPPSMTADTGRHLYSTDQNVTLTCQLTRLTQLTTAPPGGAAGLRDPDHHGPPPPYLMISSCRDKPCQGWVQSEPGRGNTELTLVGPRIQTSFGENGCQFSCWQYDSTCISSPPNPGTFHPETLACFEAGGTGVFRTVGFKELPRWKDFRCVSRNWDQLRCNWTLTSGSFGSRNDLKGLVSYSYLCLHGHRERPDTGDKEEMLLQSFANERGCTGGKRFIHNQSRPLHKSPGGDTISLDIVVEGRDFRYYKTYSFTLVIPTDVGDVTHTDSVISDKRIAQYESVNTLTVTGVDGNSTMLQVQWTMPENTHGYSGFECLLQVATMDTPWLDENQTLTVSGEDCDQGRVNLTGLHAHVTYQVYVQFRFLDSLYWSDAASASGTTSEDVPSRAPELAPWGFTRTIRDSEECLTVYIKATPPEFHNGNITGYQLEIDQQDVRVVEPPTEEGRRPSSPSSTNLSLWFPAEARALTARLGPSSPDGGARACVRVGTSAGLSPARACLRVPPRSDPRVPRAVDEVTVDYVPSTKSYEVRWRGSNGQPSGGADGENPRYTVLWCWGHHNGITLICTSEVNWKAADLNDRSSTTVHGHAMGSPFSSSSSDSGTRSTWHFGVATTVGSFSAGLVWSDCTFDDEDGRVEPPDFNLRESNERAINITWDRKCDARFAYARPLRYEISYREVNGDQAKWVTINVTAQASNGGKFSQVISNLKAGAKYSVRMRTVSTHGARSKGKEQTLPLIPEVAEKAPENVVVIVVPSVVSPAVVLLLVVIGWLCRNSVQNQRKKFAPSIQQWKHHVVWTASQTRSTSAADSCPRANENEGHSPGPTGPEPTATGRTLDKGDNQGYTPSPTDPEPPTTGKPLDKGDNQGYSPCLTDPEDTTAGETRNEEVDNQGYTLYPQDPAQMAGARTWEEDPGCLARVQLSAESTDAHSFPLPEYIGVDVAVLPTKAGKTTHREEEAELGLDKTSAPAAGHTLRSTNHSAHGVASAFATEGPPERDPDSTCLVLDPHCSQVPASSSPPGPGTDGCTMGDSYIQLAFASGTTSPVEEFDGSSECSSLSEVLTAMDQPLVPSHDADMTGVYCDNGGLQIPDLLHIGDCVNNNCIPDSLDDTKPTTVGGSNFNSCYC